MSQDRTTREKVAEMLAQGLKPRQIALLLHITTQAVYWHKARLDAAERQEATA